MTVYELLLSASHSQLSRLYTVLDKGELYYGKRLIFTGGKFIEVPFPSFLKEYSIEDLNHIELISLGDGESEQSTWVQKVKCLYEQLLDCVPLHTKYINFVPASLADPKFSLFSYDYPLYRNVLELYILFHGVQKDLEWANESHFFTPITEGCVVFRRWLK